MIDKEPLFGKTIEELQDLVRKQNLPPFTASQIARWLYRAHIQDIGNMTDLSKKARTLLEERYSLGLDAPKHVSVSRDGTKKYLFPVRIPLPLAEKSDFFSSTLPPLNSIQESSPILHRGENRWIETAFIPEQERATLCLSTQVGCKMGCRFCLTGKQGFQGNLTAGQILNQYESLPEREQITNFVYMGMGEPLDNLEEVLKSLRILTSPWGYGFSPSRITVSTIGILPGMNRYLEECSSHLAVSLHSPFEEERRLLMPIEARYPLPEILKTLRSFDLPKQRRISFEYIVFDGINHSPAHVKELARILQGIRCRINLIRFHAHPEPIPLPDGRVLSSASEEQILEFQKRLNAKGLRTTVRKSRGEDISAAYGLLSTRSKFDQVDQNRYT
ncbi:MAG TPA: 23S rRNA (adenine(2503)-C(2))-methyltransferase RlmN [Spirochaetales bacterium]|nr:23S rRNA (adenine(2503)-C(2))-methyltransferase RlmN [Spirochaetales bacterium]